MPYTIAPYDTIEVSATATVPVTCFGDSNGEMEINVTGYAGNYTYEVFDGNRHDGHLVHPFIITVTY